MRINNWNADKRVLIIAEIGNNHEGSYTLAEEMIGLACESGVDAVKFQTFQTKYFISSKDKNRFNQLKSYELTQNEFEKLSKVAKELDLIFLSTPFDIESALFLKTIVDAYKISSGDNNFYPLIKEIAQTYKPLILSTGYADIDQIKKSIQLIENIWKKKNISERLAVLHCVSAYPVEPEYANLKAIETLRNSFDCTVGYSDHTIGDQAAITSVCLGARVIEKHFTINKNYSDFIDHRISADPLDMENLVRNVRKVEIMLGSGIKEPQKPEIDSLKYVRRSIVVKNNLPQNHKIRYNDLTWIRLPGGLSPGMEDLLIGKSTIKKINAFEIINEHDVN